MDKMILNPRGINSTPSFFSDFLDPFRGSNKLWQEREVET